MRLALAEAERARDLGEVPIGCVIPAGRSGDRRGCNRPISAVDPTAHAEIGALQGGRSRIGYYNPTGARLYVTVEPCLMCVGAMVHARIGLVGVWGDSNQKSGALVSHAALRTQLTWTNHRLEILGGVLEDDCRGLMQAFFRARRQLRAR